MAFFDGGRRKGVAALLVVAAFALPHGCNLMGSDCWAAQDIVCDCASRPCQRKPPPRIVGTLEECDQDEVLKDGYHLAACIEEGPGRYCKILDAVLDDPTKLCRLDCSAGCNLEERCHRYQNENCDAPPGEGGAGGT